MKKLILILLLLPIFVFGQYENNDYEIKTSTPYKVIDAYTKMYFNRGNDILMYKRTKKEIILQKYDAEKKKEIFRKSYPVLEKGDIYQGVYEFGENLFFLYSRWDKKTETFHLYSKTIDFDKGTFGSSKKLLTIKDGNSSKKYGLGFSLDKSFDESKILIKYTKKRTSRDDHKSTDRFGMYILDMELNIVWEGEVKMPYTEAQMNNKDFTIDRKGRMYMLTEVFDTDVSKKYIKDEKNYHLEMIIVEDGDINIQKLNEKEYYINSIWIKESSDGKIYLAGYYNKERGYYKNVEGVFLMQLNEEGRVENTSHHDIPLEVINMYKKERVQTKNKKKKSKGKLDFESLLLDKIFYQEDGSIIIIGEQYYVTTHTSTDSNGNTTTTYRYHYNDVLLTKIDEDGDLAWMRKLPKRQTGSRGKGGMSYKHIYKNGNHLFFYLDNKANIDLPKNERPKGHSDGAGGIFTIYEVNDESGEVNKKSLFDMREVNISGYNKPLEVYQFSTDRILETENGIAVEVYKKRKEDIMIHIGFK